MDAANAALMRRIVQLEKERDDMRKERDELQKDVETICLQQAGVASSVDVSTRMQARRATSLEQELDLCREKTTLLTRENQTLQQEVSEAFRLKGQLTEAFKRAVEKNNGLEKEVKFYQGKVAAAIAERDKAIVEVERVNEAEKEMTSKVQRYHNRVQEAEKQSKEQDTRILELQNQLDILYKVVDKFWGLRENVTASEDTQLQHMQPLDRATALLSESEGQWTYGGCNREAEEALRQELKDVQTLAEENGLVAKEEQSRANELDAQLAKLKEEVEATTHSLQIELEKQDAQQLVAEKASTYEIQLEKLRKFTISKVLEVQADHEDVRTRVDSLLEDEKQWIDSMAVSFEALLSELKASEVHPEIVDKYEEQRDPPQEETPIPAAELSEPDALEEHPLPVAEPSRTVGLEENLSPADEAFRTVDSEELHTSEDTIELEESALPSHDQNAPELVHSESSPGRDISVMISTSPLDLPEIMAGAHPIAENDDNRMNEPFRAVVRTPTDMDEESRKVLAQALKEKVEALLLLSQQEERYYMESKSIQGLESQIKDLNEKITQVTREKVSALMEVAQLRQDCQRLEEREKELIRRLQLHRSTNAGGRLLPASWSESKVLPEKPGVVTEKQLVLPKSITTSGYLKNWLRGIDMSGTLGSKAASEPTKQSVATTASKSTATEETVDLAKLRVENVALQEQVAGVQRLTESAHRLRMTLLKVSTDLETQQSQKSLNSALETVGRVKKEASHLRIALTCSLPVSVTPESPLPQLEGSTVSSGEGIPHSGDGEVLTGVDVATGAGIEMVELLLAACEVQKGGLQRQIDLHNLQFKDSGTSGTGQGTTTGTVQDTTSRTDQDTTSRTDQDTTSRTDQDTTSRTYQDTTSRTDQDTTSRTGQDTTSRTGQDTTSGTGKNSSSGTGQDSTSGAGHDSTSGAGQDSTSGAGQDSTSGAGQDSTSGAGQDSTSGAGQDSTSRTAQETTYGAGKILNIPVLNMGEGTYFTWDRTLDNASRTGKILEMAQQGCMVPLGYGKTLQVGEILHLRPCSISYLRNGKYEIRGRADITSGTGQDIASGTGQDIASGTGQDIASGAGQDILSGTGQDIASGTGQDIASGTGQDIASGTRDDTPGGDDEEMDGLAAWSQGG